MKAKIKNVIAAVTATALIGSAVGIGTYSFAQSSNDFGFKGTYDLTAFAEEEASESTITVLGNAIDTTSTLTLKSSDEEQAYTLFVTVVDTDDMTALADIEVGYTVGGNTYNGQTSGLSNVVYSSLTVKTGNEETPTATATAEELAEDFDKISTAKLVIAEVETSTVGANTAELTINGKQITSETPVLNYYAEDFSDGSINSSWFNINDKYSFKGSELTEVTYQGKTFSGNALKLESSTSIKFKLTESGTLTLVFNEAAGNVKINGTASSNATNNVLTIDLEAGVCEITKKDVANLYYISVSTTGLVNTDIPVTYTEIKEVAATCLSAGTAAYWLGSDGNKYSKNGDSYTLIEDESTLVLAQLDHTYSEKLSSNADGHYHECTVCGAKDTVIEHSYGDGTTCTVCGYEQGTEEETTSTTYEYYSLDSYGTTVGTWEIISGNGTGTSADGYTGTKLKSSSIKLTLSCTGTKATVTLEGFCYDSSSSMSVIVEAFNDTTSLGTITGSTVKDKKNGTITFETNTLSGNITSIVIRTESGKNIVITKAIIVVES